MGYYVHIIADAEAALQLPDVVGVFASAKDFAFVSVDGDRNTLDRYDDWSALPPYIEYYEGRWVTLRFSREPHMPPGSFSAEFRHRDEVWFPRDDLSALASEFIDAVSEIDGVIVQSPE